MPSYNRVILIGRLTRDPELRYTSGGLAVTSFTIAVDRRFKNPAGERQTDFFDCTAWRQKAEFVANYVAKGRLVAVEGAIEFNEAVGQDGQKRRYTKVVCDNVETLDGPRDAGEGGGASGMDANSGAMGGGMAGGGNSGGGAQARGGQGGGNARPAAANVPAGDDNGYFPDEDAPATSAPRAQAAQAARPAQGGGSGGANAGGAAARPAAGGARPPAAPQPAYPEDDFDDSDPFADQ